VRSISGDSKSERYLEPLSHKDSRGEVWTHYWDYQHVYSRFDYVLASKTLRPLFDQKRSRIIDDPEWSSASDHRPLLSIFTWN
jgi:endonuclease/exonuclease/phosphatase family metal-dependent hydrolase